MTSSLSEFLVAFCLQELVFGSPLFLRDRQLTVRFESGELGPASAILSKGRYVHSGPGEGHSVFVVGGSVLVCRFHSDDGSLGFAARDAVGSAILTANQSGIATVTLTTPNHWQLTIAEDGSARVSHWGKLERAAILPAASFDFVDVRDRLRASSEPGGDVRKGYSVYFMRAGRNYASWLTVREPELAATIWTRAIVGAIDRGSEFDRFAVESPPAP